MLSEQKQFSPDTNIHLFMGSIVKYPIHWHNSLEIIAVLNGTIHLKDGFESHTVSEGEVIVINDNDLHAITGQRDENTVIILNIDVTRLKTEQASIKDTIIVCDSNTDKIKYARELKEAFRLVLNIYILCYQNDDIKINSTRQKLNELAALLINNFRYLRMLENSFSSIDSSDSHVETLGGTMDYIYNNFKEKITLQDISFHENISTYYISHLIKKVSGLTFQEYLGMLRAESSEKLLIASNKSIAEIAFESGFSDVKYYNKHFKRWYGMTPGDYRKECKDFFHSSDKTKELIDQNLTDAGRYFDKHLGSDWKEMLSSNEKTTFISIADEMKPRNNMEFSFPSFVLDCNDFNSVLIFKKQLQHITCDLPIRKLDLEFSIKNDVLDQLAQLEMLLNDIPANELNNIERLVLRLKIQETRRDSSYVLIYNEIKNIISNVCSYYNRDFRLELVYQDHEIKNKSILDDFIMYIKSNMCIKDISIIEGKNPEKSITDYIDISNFNSNTYDSVNIFPWVTRNVVSSGKISRGAGGLYSHKLIDAFEIGKVFNNDQGIITSSGLKKASYQFYSLFNKMGNDIIEVKNNYILSKNDQIVSLLLYNFTGSEHEQTNSTKMKFIIDFKSMKNHIKYCKYTLNKENGCIYNNYIEYNSPSFLSAEEVEIFERLSYPKTKIGTIDSIDSSMIISLAPRSVTLFVFYFPDPV